MVLCCIWHLFFCNLRCFVTKSVLLRFRRFYVEKKLKISGTVNCLVEMIHWSGWKSSLELFLVVLFQAFPTHSHSWRTRGRRCTRRWWHCSSSRPGLPPLWNHNQSLQGRGAPIKDKLFEEHFPWKSSKVALTGSKISAILSLTLYQALAAPTRSFCPRASSRSNKGIPTTSSITRNGMMNAPEKAHFRFLSGTHPYI